MGAISSLEGVNNPRPIIVEVHKQDKSGVLHYVMGDRKSACGQAHFWGSFLGGQSNESTIVNDITDENNTYVKLSLVCPECKVKYDEMDESEE
jgi:hypothetical protein